MLTAPLADGAELRALEPWLAPEFHAFVERNRAHLATWLPWAERIDSPAVAEEWLRGYAEDQARDGRRLFGIWLDDVLVGGVGFASFNAAWGTCELGAWIGSEASGRGLVTLAAGRLADWAMRTRGLTRVEWRATVENTRSIAVAKRLGMTREGIMRSALPMHGRRYDLEVWALVAAAPSE